MGRNMQSLPAESIVFPNEPFDYVLVVLRHIHHELSNTRINIQMFSILSFLTTNLSADAERRALGLVEPCVRRLFGRVRLHDAA